LVVVVGYWLRSVGGRYRTVVDRLRYGCCTFVVVGYLPVFRYVDCVVTLRCYIAFRCCLPRCYVGSFGYVVGLVCYVLRCVVGYGAVAVTFVPVCVDLFYHHIAVTLPLLLRLLFVYDWLLVGCRCGYGYVLLPVLFVYICWVYLLLPDLRAVCYCLTGYWYVDCGITLRLPLHGYAILILLLLRFTACCCYVGCTLLRLFTIVVGRCDCVVRALRLPLLTLFYRFTGCCYVVDCVVGWLLFTVVPFYVRCCTGVVVTVDVG